MKCVYDECQLEDYEIDFERDDGEWHDECYELWTEREVREHAHLRHSMPPVLARDVVDTWFEELVDRADNARKARRDA